MGTALLDVNVLMALAWSEHVHHDAAHRRFAAVANSWATAPVTESGLVRLLLTPAVTGRPVSGDEALGLLRAFRALPGWRWLPDDVSLIDGPLDLSVLMGRRQVTDLHLVALAARHEARLITFDAGIPRLLAPADHAHVEVWSS